jgi:hypothetical protein
MTSDCETDEMTRFAKLFSIIPLLMPLSVFGSIYPAENGIHEDLGSKGFRSEPDPRKVAELPGSTEKLSSAESVTTDGRIDAYGTIDDVGEKNGHRYLNIDYGEWISEEECRRRVEAGTLDLDENDCEVDSLRYADQNPKLGRFGVADDAQISILRPSLPIKSMTWDQFAEMWRTRTESTRELWDGIWHIYRRGDLVDRIEWVYTP